MINRAISTKSNWKRSPHHKNISRRTRNGVDLGVFCGANGEIRSVCNSCPRRGYPTRDVVVVMLCVIQPINPSTELYLPFSTIDGVAMQYMPSFYHGDNPLLTSISRMRNNTVSCEDPRAACGREHSDGNPYRDHERLSADMIYERQKRYKSLRQNSCNCYVQLLYC